MDNGVICNGVNYIQFENNEFSNIIGNLTNLYVDASLGSEVKGRGIFIKGGGFFGGVHIRGSRFNNVTKGVNTVSVPNAVNVTQNNVFTNVYDGVIATNNNTIFPLNLNVKGNVFDCTRYGVFSNNNIGHDFIVQDNYFSQPANAVTNSGGLRILANTPGFFGRQGKGNVLRNEFFNEAINHSNGSLQISNINSVEVTQGNKVHILGISNNPALNGHQGFNFTNVNSTLVTDNILRNMTGISYQGSNLWSNSTNNAVCCNELYGMQSGLSLINIGTDRSTIKHNLLDDNAQGIQLTTNCKIGDQIDHGNVWTGASRVAKYTDIDTDKNRFHANQEQNTATQWFWPTQKPRVWFIESSNVASDICDNICDVPLGDIAEATEPSISSIAILEEMLDHDHIVSEAQREPGIWAKERWLYGYLTQYPHLRDLSVPLTDFYDHVAEDVKLYEDFYRALLDVVTPPENELAASVEAGLEAESIINQANLLWAQYRDQPSAVVKDALDALQADLAAIVPSGAVYLEASNDSRLAALHTLKTEIENLPTNKPYTAVAQQYAYILLDAFIYGDGYVQQHHLVDLIAVAQLCEPLYKESVVCARNMLVSLGYTPDYDDTMCQEYTQPRSSVDIDSDQISVSPNPTSGRIHIDAEQKINGITIQDVHGTVIKEVKGEARQIDISDMSDGMYYMTIYTMSHAVIVKKIIKIQ